MSFGSDTLLLGVAWFVAFLFSTTLHEAAHALVAWKLGDPTAYGGGQVSLSPIPHIRREPIGMVVIPIVSFALGGWMFGWASAPYDPTWAERWPRRAAWMALGGPVANLALTLTAGLAIRLGVLAEIFFAPERLTFSTVVQASSGPAAGAATVLSILFTLNLILFAFNLLPLPPLDGSGVIQLFMPEATARRYQSFVRQPILALAGILVAWRLFGPLFDPVLTLALNILHPGAGYH